MRMGKKSLYKNRGGFQNLPQKLKPTILTKKWEPPTLVSTFPNHQPIHINRRYRQKWFPPNDGLTWPTFFMLKKDLHSIIFLEYYNLSVGQSKMENIIMNVNILESQGAAVGFFLQICDVAEMAIIHEMI